MKPIVLAVHLAVGCGSFEASPEASPTLPPDAPGECEPACTDAGGSCGDGRCSAPEDCGSCPADCGRCRADCAVTVAVPPGVYALDEVVTAPGTPTAPRCHRPVTPGTVTIRGGATLRHSHVTLDGFLFDGTLDPEYPTRGNGLRVGEGVVARIENSELKATAHDVHTGYAWGTDVRDCTEAEHMPSSSALTVYRQADVTLVNVVAHGAYNGTNTIEDAKLRVERSLFRNNFNTFQIGDGTVFELIDSVLWDSPNHVITYKATRGGSLTMENSLVVVGQATIGSTSTGGDAMLIRHSTFYTPANHVCGNQVSVGAAARVRAQVTLESNLFVNNSGPWWAAASAQLAFYRSDYSLGHQWDPRSPRRELRWNGVDVPLEEWQRLTGLDAHTRRGQPLFVDAPVYADVMPAVGRPENAWGFRVPKSTAEARAWFQLRPGSPGRTAAPDGRDIGIHEP